VKQVVQDIRSGRLQVIEAPDPQPVAGHVLVSVTHSLISAGTERALVELGAKSLLGKARARPDIVGKTIGVARAEGVGTAITKVRSRLDRYTELGYSCAGEVIDTGGDARLSPGMPVACVGAGYAVHAGVVSVPSNLVVPLRPEVPMSAAAFAAPAAIALHALRLADAGPGAVVVVIGLGLIGQLGGRLAAAAGCNVCGTDPRGDRRDRFGPATEAVAMPTFVHEASRGRGADAVLVCASSPRSDAVSLATELARDRARIVVVGDVGLDLARPPLYEKELSIVVARSYGPGRYERAYEERGLDYPPGYVRWTEGRNVEAVVDLLASGALEVADLVTHRFPVSEAASAFGTLKDDPAALGILLDYDREDRARGPVRLQPAREKRAGSLRVGVIGAGDFARGTLLPALVGTGNVELAAACARSGASARSLAERFGFSQATTDWRAVVDAADVDAVVIATPHAEHAEIAAAALAAGKAAFVEKPLAIDWDGLSAVAANPGLLLVGHNRRFAPLAGRLRDAFQGPAVIQIRVAVAPLASGHWLNDPEQGGQVLGELSHFVDLASFLAGAPPVEVDAQAIGKSILVKLRFETGSGATIAYSVGEPGELPKERIEVLSAEGAGVLDDFVRLELYGPKSSVWKAKRDKGHTEELRAFVAAARGVEPLPVSFEEQLLVAAATLAAVDSARTAAQVSVRLPL
jgi:predicted dehydrogenase/threonine dehydrogenase-like Zn-dependent dehydrogenase